jgi:inner membrane protein YidH
MSTPDRASDHLANERTFLAWVRTSLSIIVFGFVVAKFGITLRQFLSLQGRKMEGSSLSLVMGVVFMATGIALAVVSLYRYQDTRRRLETGEFRPATAVIVVVGVMTAIFGGILAGYLLLTAHTL